MIIKVRKVWSYNPGALIRHQLESIKLCTLWVVSPRQTDTVWWTPAKCSVIVSVCCTQGRRFISDDCYHHIPFASLNRRRIRVALPLFFWLINPVYKRYKCFCISLSPKRSIKHSLPLYKDRMSIWLTCPYSFLSPIDIAHGKSSLCHSYDDYAEVNVY